MPTTTTDQDRAIQDLSIRVGLTGALQIEAGRDLTNEPDDDTVIVSWEVSDRTAVRPRTVRSCLVLADGTIDLGGGSGVLTDPLQLWAEARNREIAGTPDPPMIRIDWVVQRWDDDQCDTICEGVHPTEQKAVDAAAKLATQIAGRIDGRVVVPEPDDGGTRWIVCQAEYLHSEPTDDERHHAIWIQQVRTQQDA